MENEQIYTVIVAEDEELILNSIVKKIGAPGTGFRVIGTAQDGKTALELIEKLSPDVLVTDIMMPVMNGLELANTVYARYPHMEKIIITGYDEFSYAQQALRFEVRDYLLKPIKKETLTETMNRLYIRLNAQTGELNAHKLKLADRQSYSPEEIVNMVELYIKEHYTQEINFDLIAQNFNFNASYLSRIFTKHTGENPSKYLISLRINKAKHLLLHRKDLSIKVVGELVGYPNQYHFSHIFKTLTGKSPAHFRDSSGEPQQE
jgi:YesN/AraC family two-component response regulator